MNAGSIVQLKSGGPMMTVIEYQQGQLGIAEKIANCICVYFDAGGNKVTVYFNENVLIDHGSQIVPCDEKQSLSSLPYCQYPNSGMPQAAKCQYAKWHFAADEWKCRYNQPCPFQGYDPNPNYLIKVKQEKK